MRMTFNSKIYGVYTYDSYYWICVGWGKSSWGLTVGWRCGMWKHWAATYEQTLMGQNRLWVID